MVNHRAVRNSQIRHGKPERLGRRLRFRGFFFGLALYQIGKIKRGARQPRHMNLWLFQQHLF